MTKKRNGSRNSRDAPTQKCSGGWLCSSEAWKVLCMDGYRPLTQCPEVQMCAGVYADMISSMTIHLMQNTNRGDVRVKNELSRKLDISPNTDMTRQSFVSLLVSTLMLYGNQVTIPRYDRRGYLTDLQPVPPSLVSLQPDGESYRVYVNGVAFRPDEVLHFVLRPNPERPWQGDGYQVSLRDVVKSLRQTSATKQAVMENPVPSIIVKVDGLTEEFASSEGREKLRAQYLSDKETGAPWFIPAEAFTVEQVKPLTLNDLAIKTNLELDKKSIASMLKVPGFMVGVGEFSAKEFDWFVSVPCMTVAKIIEQELTRKTLLSPDWYWKMNNRTLLNYDIERIVSVGKELVDRATMRRNELRDWLGMSPDPEMDDVLILENYLRKNKNDLSDAQTGGEENA